MELSFFKTIKNTLVNLFKAMPDDWSVVWYKTSKWYIESPDELDDLVIKTEYITHITYCIIRYSKARNEYTLEINGKYSPDMLCYKQAVNELAKLENKLIK